MSADRVCNHPRTSSKECRPSREECKIHSRIASRGCKCKDSYLQLSGSRFLANKYSKLIILKLEGCRVQAGWGLAEPGLYLNHQVFFSQ